MITKSIPKLGVFEAWRLAARELLARKVPPDHVCWDDQTGQMAMFDDAASAPTKLTTNVTVPKEFLNLARFVVAHQNNERFSWAYKVLWRLQNDPGLLSNPADVDVHQLQVIAKSVSRDCHKMKAFVRFRELESSGDRRVFGAWFEPDHNIVELTGSFFARRFADMDWTISTPLCSAIFVQGHLSYALATGIPKDTTDPTEDLWLTYYSSIFNPARLKIKAMRNEMPQKYWKNLPEAALIPDLIAGAAQRVQSMRVQMPSQPPAYLDKFKAPIVKNSSSANESFASIDEVRIAAACCTSCVLHCHATQTVFGEGNARADIVFVGEQPGDQEDLSGKPFVGRAGEIFNDALGVAGIDRSSIYVTNAVKHFKFSPRGKRRIHKRPDRIEIQHCKWWLDKELDLIKPKLVVAMGATAVWALTGRTDGIKNMRGSLHKSAQVPDIFATYHPSAILRNHAESAVIRRDFYADIASVKLMLRL